MIFVMAVIDHYQQLRGGLMRTGRPGGTVPRERGFRPDSKPYQVASRDEVGMMTPSMAPWNINQFGLI